MFAVAEWDILAFFRFGDLVFADLAVSYMFDLLGCGSEFASDGGAHFGFLAFGLALGVHWPLFWHFLPEDALKGQGDTVSGSDGGIEGVVGLGGYFYGDSDVLDFMDVRLGDTVSLL